MVRHSEVHLKFGYIMARAIPHPYILQGLILSCVVCGVSSGGSGQGAEGKRVKRACSMTTGLNSTEAGCFWLLLRDPDAGRHTCGAHIHVHIEDSKSLPSLAHPQAWQRRECALCGLTWAEAKKLLPSVSSSGGRDLKSKHPQH